MLSRIQWNYLEKAGGMGMGRIGDSSVQFPKESGLGISASGRVREEQEPGEGAVVLAAGVGPVPVPEGLHPHLVALSQPQQNHVGRLVNVLAVERVPGPQAARAIHHQCRPQGPVAHREVVGEHVDARVGAVELAGGQVVVVLSVVEDLVEADGEARGGEGLAGEEPHAEARARLLHALAVGALHSAIATVASLARGATVSLQAPHATGAHGSGGPL